MNRKIVVYIAMMATLFGCANSAVELDEVEVPPSVSHQVLIDSGVNLLYQDQYEESLKVFVQAIENYPDNPKAFYYKGVIHRLKGEFGESLQSLNDGLKLADSSQTAQFFYEFSHVKANLEMFDEARKDADQFLDQTHDTVGFMLALGHLKTQAQDYETALNIYDQVLFNRPSFKVVLLLKAVTFEEAGLRDSACITLSQAHQVMDIDTSDRYNTELRELVRACQ